MEEERLRQIMVDEGLAHSQPEASSRIILAGAKVSV